MGSWRTSRSAERSGRRSKTSGAPVQQTGVFDGPPHSMLVFRSENFRSMHGAFAWVVSIQETASSDAARVSRVGHDRLSRSPVPARPFLPAIGAVGDKREKTWTATARFPEQKFPDLIESKELQMDHGEKSTKGFFPGIGVQHVCWRVENPLDSRSCGHGFGVLCVHSVGWFNPVASRQLLEDTEEPTHTASPCGTRRSGRAS